MLTSLKHTLKREINIPQHYYHLRTASYKCQCCEHRYFHTGIPDTAFRYILSDVGSGGDSWMKLTGGFYHAKWRILPCLNTNLEPSKDRKKSGKTDYKLNVQATKPWTITRIIFSGKLLPVYKWNNSQRA